MSKKLNDYPTVVSNSTRYTGGKNPCPVVVTNPTRYTGGLNKDACNIPKKK